VRLARAQLALAEGDADGIPTLTQALLDLPAPAPLRATAPAREVDYDALHAAAQSLRASDLLDAEPAWISAPATALSSLLYA
jgi:hypothetical protein